MFVFKTLFFLFCLDISWATGTNYPPGVPPKRDNADGGIQFHEPGEFKQQQQKMVRGRHNHHGAKINFQGQDSKEAREHMKAHNKEKYVDVDKLSQPQLIMQHFRNYDLDHNGKIDGLEILKAAANMNEEHSEENDEDESFTQFDFMEMALETDETLRTYDENNDGFIHYGEFYRNHKKMLDEQQK